MKAAVPPAARGWPRVMQLGAWGGRGLPYGCEGENVDGSDLMVVEMSFASLGWATDALSFTWPLRIMILAWKGLVDVRVEQSAHAVPVGIDAIGR